MKTNNKTKVGQTKKYQPNGIKLAGRTHSQRETHLGNPQQSRTTAVVTATADGIDLKRFGIITVVVVSSWLSAVNAFGAFANRWQVAIANSFTKDFRNSKLLCFEPVITRPAIPSVVVPLRIKLIADAARFVHARTSERTLLMRSTFETPGSFNSPFLSMKNQRLETLAFLHTSSMSIPG